MLIGDLIVCGFAQMLVANRGIHKTELREAHYTFSPDHLRWGDIRMPLAMLHIIYHHYGAGLTA